MDHGVGLQWHGDRTIENIALNASRVLAPNEFLRQRYVANGIATEIIGTPKLDEMLKVPYRPDGPIAISFHWMSASRSQILIRYRDALEDLAGHVWLIGHGHPRAWFLLEPFWRSIGVEPVQSFDEVLERASIYVCDHSSTLYEWAALDRRVVLLDHPGQQALIRISSGLRYQHFADIGPHATPDTLWEAIAEPDRAMAARREATAALFPYLGAAVPRTLEVLRGR